ncbi:MAG: tRNA (guanosine(46)-N7)-methyltransferase TrmB [Clostridia bacterium]|nr:tRNA (guanosine(46)-N7)-methyltransferase TrmB [Clostridia bacterium]
MRMRKKKHGAERIAACSDILIRSADDIPFEAPYELEIGCGKGSFIVELARRNPDRNYIAVEKISDVILLAMEKAKAAELTNVRFLIGDAGTLTEVFKKGDISRIYLNFSDPWPKAGYAKRRLTHRGFLEKYKSILTDDGEIHFKTDNRVLFDFSLEEFEACGFALRNVTNDLHNSPYNEGNIVTEYETNFSAKGFTINRVEAYLK